MRSFLPLAVPLVCAITGAVVQAADPSPHAPVTASPDASPAAPAVQTAPIAPRATAMRQDRAGRPVISALFNGQGPFDMVVDTGAQSTVIAPSLAQDLRLAPLPGESISVVGVSGASQVAL